ncbi:MAG: hypothetical protein A3E01_13025 [Gammaproteobacteria bacterium RIFCSPHIGHO2_12_FULL_63_22]|nr:MAG: hypothetical protein A3E01_13025 [Gammaproteobacteria bacterium RIFCSPHIGHO2_12_FULL_63_22]
MRHKSTILGIAASCLLALSTPLLAAGQATQEALPAAHKPVTAAACTDCHEAESKTHVFHGECTTCHVNAKSHASAESPRKVSPGQPKAEQCLTCHNKDSARLNFKFSDHHRAGVACASCHGVHAPKPVATSLALLKADTPSKLCATCHKDVLAKFNMPSHHPVQEGGVSCVGCHDPHSSKQVSLVSNTEQCLTCHQRIRGPFAFEHVPAAEDCANCHDPHGTPNRRLLVAAQPMLCLQCHALPNNRHGQTGSNATTPTALGQTISGAVLRNCSACHSQVHGSMQDEHLRY